MTNSPALEYETGTCTLVVVVVTLVVLPSLVRPQKSSPLQQSPTDDYTIRVNVDEVVLHATAQNHKNTLISGLGKEEFQVYEDGVRQEISHFSHQDIPVTVGLVVDNSGSMRPKRADVIAAALAFVRSSNPMDQMFVVTIIVSTRTHGGCNQHGMAHGPVRPVPATGRGAGERRIGPDVAL